MSRLARKLDVLRSEREAIQEEVEANEVLGAAVASRVSSVATPTESNKVSLHVAEVDKITALLLALAGRLARAQNALLSLHPHTDAPEKVTTPISSQSHPILIPFSSHSHPILIPFSSHAHPMLIPCSSHSHLSSFHPSYPDPSTS